MLIFVLLFYLFRLFGNIYILIYIYVNNNHNIVRGPCKHYRFVYSKDCDKYSRKTLSGYFWPF